MKAINEATNVIDLGYDKSDLDQIKDWIREHNITVIIPTKDVDDLDDLWQKWNRMTQYEKNASDQISMQIFHMKNFDHYRGLRNKFYNGISVIDTSPDSYVTSNLIMDESAIDIFNELISNINESISYSDKRNLINEAKEKMNYSSHINEYQIINNYPYFTPVQLIEMGIRNIAAPSKNYYKELPDNYYIDEEKIITTREWFNDYILSSIGFVTEDTTLYINKWKDKLTSLYADYPEILKENNIKKINARKQSILELGWNPEIDFNTKNRIAVNKMNKDRIIDRYRNVQIENITSLVNSNEPDNSIINESSEKDDNKLYPIYITLSYTYTKFGKLVSAITKFKYSHATFSLDPSLEKMFTFGRKGTHGGFSIENIKKYPNKNNKSILSVFVIFVKKNDFIKIKLKLDSWLDKIKATSYSFLTALGLLLNKPVQYSTKMICSEFVDALLKSVNIDITNKPSGLVTPKDIYNSSIKNKKIYKVYEGFIKDYSPKKVKNIVSRIRNKTYYIKENAERPAILESQFIHLLKSYDNNINDLLNLEVARVENSDIYNLYEEYISPIFHINYINEADEFPIEFNKDGDLLIKKKKNIDFEKEFANTHKLLKLYSSNNNNYAMAYELSKLWYLNLLLEDRIYSKHHSEEELKSYHKARAKILNDFNKYLKELQSHENMKDFNFERYYDKSPFSKDKIKISRHTMHYSGKYLKNIIKALLS